MSGGDKDPQRQGNNTAERAGVRGGGGGRGSEGGRGREGGGRN